MRHRLPFRPSDYLIDQDWRSTVRSGTLAGQYLLYLVYGDDIIFCVLIGENEGIYSSSSRPYFALDSDLRLLGANVDLVSI